MKDKGWVLVLIIVLFYAIFVWTTKDLLGILFMVTSVFLIGQLVKRHQNRIDREVERGIVHKHELEDNKIGDKNVIVEFAPPKGLSPIEVGYLYDMEIGEEDIVCLLYKWAEMRIISLSCEDSGLLKVEKMGLISDIIVPEYEVKFWDMIFEQGDIVYFPNEFSYENLGDFKDSVKEYCEKKGWITEEDVYFSVDDFFKTIIPGKKPSKDISYIPYGRLSGFTLGFFLIIIGAILFLGSLILGKMIVVSGVIFACLFVVGVMISFSFAITLTETANKHAIKLTEKGQEIVAEIYGYKKFLEACEEKQFREFMRQDPLYLDKVLSYAIALGLENIISQKLPRNLLEKEGSLADFLRFEKVID